MSPHELILPGVYKVSEIYNCSYVELPRRLSESPVSPLLDSCPIIYRIIRIVITQYSNVRLPTYSFDAPLRKTPTIILAE